MKPWPHLDQFGSGGPACVSPAGKDSGAGGTPGGTPEAAGGTPGGTSHQSCDFEDVFRDIVADGPVFAEHLDTLPHAGDGLFAAFAAGKDVGQ